MIMICDSFPFVNSSEDGLARGLRGECRAVRANPAARTRARSRAENFAFPFRRIFWWGARNQNVRQNFLRGRPPLTAADGGAGHRPSKKVRAKDIISPPIFKIRILKIGGMFWLKSEPILGKTPTLTFSPPPAAADRKSRRLGRKKFPPLKPLHFLPARRNLRAEKFFDNFIIRKNQLQTE